jgi:hypothetical protein
VVLIETLIIAAVVSLGIIVAGKAIATARAISRRRSHHLATHTGVSPVPPAVDVRPPE